MAVGERTYTFRASGDLGERIRAVSEALDTSPELVDRVAAQFALAIARDPASLHGARGNQSAFIRQTMELLVRAAEKVASDAEYEKLYAEEAADRSDDEIEFREAANADAVRRWRDL